MAKKEIIWTHTAAKQRRQILEYWTERNRSTNYALKLISLISKHLRIIQKTPLSFKEADFNDVRESAMGHFSIDKDFFIHNFS